MISAKEEAASRMAHGMAEFLGGFADFIQIALTDFAQSLAAISESGPGMLARIAELNKDELRWNARGPIRRVQLRKARAMMEGQYYE